MKSSRLFVLAAVGVLSIGVAIPLNKPALRAQPKQPSRPAAPERFDGNTVSAVGDVRSVSAVTLRCPLLKPTTILRVVREGQFVKKGDVVVDLDSAPLENDLAEKQVLLTNAESSLVQALEESDAAQENLKASVTAAKASVVAAEKASSAYLAEDGEYQLKLTIAESEMTVAAEQLKVFTERVARLSRLPKDAVADIDGLLAEANVAIVEARAAREIAYAKKIQLEKHERPLREAKLEAALLAAKAELTYVRLAGTAKVNIAKAQVGVAEASLDLRKREVAQLKKEISAARIIAPRDGRVVYANRYSSRGAAAGFVVEEGAQVRPAQAIILLPDLSQLEVKVKVSEAEASRLRSGQPAKIQVDAFVEREWRGHVDRVSDFPEAGDWANRGVKRYTAYVRLKAPHDRVRIGMTAMVRIDVSGDEKK